MTQKKIISSLAMALFSTIFVGGIFYLTDNRFGASDEDKMFSWGFVLIYFVGMFIGSLFMNQMMQFFKNLFVKKK